MTDMTDTLSKNAIRRSHPVSRRLFGIFAFWMIVSAIIVCRVVYFDQVAASAAAPQAQISSR